MSQEPQGLVKYECFMCSKQFIVGMVDEEEAQLQDRVIRCPFCGFAADSLAFIEYEAIERAINVEAEAEVERLQTELAQLRKVADLVSTMQESESGYSARLVEIEMLKALEEYQTWKEGQDG